MVSSALESLKHNRSYSFSPSPLNTHNLGNTFQLSHCQNNVIVSPNVIRTQFIQTWAKSEAVLHSCFFLIIKGFWMPFPFPSAHGCHALWQGLIEKGSLYISEQVHDQHWSQSVLIWSETRPRILNQSPPSLCLCWSVFLSACLSFYLSVSVIFLIRPLK